jgi:conjugal transfer mating pair stabilization protein TraG
MYEVFTYWNAESVIGVLNAIAIVMGGGDYLGLMRALAIAGLLVAAGIGLAKVSAKEPLQYVVFLGLFYFGLMVPKVTVDVVDMRTGATGSVANVPFGIAFFYSTTSRIGRFLTNTFETSFQPSNNLRFGTTGMGFGARAFQETASARVRDPRLAEALRELTRACINPEIIDNPSKYKELAESENIIGLVSGSGWLNPARHGTFPDRAGVGYSYMPCDTAMVYAQDWLDADAMLTINHIGQRLNPDKSSPSASWVPAQTVIAGQLADVEAYMLQTGRSALAQVKQGMMANAISDSGGTLAVARNDPAAMAAALAAKTAEMQANSAYRTLGLIGEAALPKFRNIVEVVIISVFPIVMLLVVLGGEKGGLVLKTYVMTSVWVQLWAPLYAIVNFLMLSGTASRLQASLDGAASQNIMNTAALTMTAFKESSLAGALVFAVPVIAYALVKGGEVAMSGALSGMTGTASGAAAQQGGAVGLGQVAVGNTAWGNHSSNNMAANKWDTSGSMSHGGWSQRRGQFAMAGTNALGSDGDHAAADGSGTVANLGAVSASLGKMAQRAVSSMVREGFSQATSSTQAAVRSFAAAVESYGGSERASSGDRSVSQSSSFGGSSSDQSSFGSLLRSSTQWGDKFRLTDSQRAQATFAAGLSGNAGKGAFARLVQSSAGAGAFSASDVDHAYEKAKEASQSSDFQKAVSLLRSAGSETSSGSTSSTSQRASAGTRAHINDAFQHAATAQQASQRVEALERLGTEMGSSSGALTANLANAVQKALGGTAGVAELQRMSVPEQARAVEKAMGSMIAAHTGGSHLGGSGGPSASRGAQIEAGVSDATRQGVQPMMNGQTVFEVAKFGGRHMGSIPKPQAAPQLAGADGSITQASVQATASNALDQRSQGIDGAGKAVAGSSGQTSETVGRNHTQARGDGAMVRRVTDMSLNTVTGIVGGGRLPDQGTTVEHGTRAPAPPEPAPGDPAHGANAIPKGPPMNAPTPKR